MYSSGCILNAISFQICASVAHSLKMCYSNEHWSLFLLFTLTNLSTWNTRGTFHMCPWVFHLISESLSFKRFFQMKVCVLLTAKEARAHVSAVVGEVPRTTFYRWRSFLGLIQDTYTLDEVESIALFGGYIRKGMNMERAFSACQRQIELQG